MSSKDNSLTDPRRTVRLVRINQPPSLYRTATCNVKLTNTVLLSSRLHHCSIICRISPASEGFEPQTLPLDGNGGLPSPDFLVKIHSQMLDPPVQLKYSCTVCSWLVLTLIITVWRWCISEQLTDVIINWCGYSVEPIAIQCIALVQSDSVLSRQSCKWFWSTLLEVSHRFVAKPCCLCCIPTISQMCLD